VGELWLPLYSSYIFRALFASIKLNITYQKKKKIHHLLVFEIPTFCGQISQPTIDSHDSHEKCVTKNRYEAGRGMGYRSPTPDTDETDS
jgi:hypothetical protein